MIGVRLGTTGWRFLSEQKVVSMFLVLFLVVFNSFVAVFLLERPCEANPGAETKIIITVQGQPVADNASDFH